VTGSGELSGVPVAALDNAATTAPTAQATRRAVRATYIAFVAVGTSFASIASRLPQIRDLLHVTPAALGLLLLCVALGSVCGMPAAGVVTARFGTGRTVAAMSVVYAVGVAIVAFAVTQGSLGVAIGFYLLGVGNGMWDVSMNVQGAHVERELGRSIMSRFHAGFSIGTVVGAAIGAVMVATDVSVRVHLLVVAAAVVAIVPVSVRGFLPDPPQHHEHTEGGKRRTFAAWTELRTLLIGIFVLCMAFTEGTGNDWLSIAMIDGYGTRAVAGTIAFAVFLTTMTIGRWFGPGIIDRHGRVLVLRVSAVAALVGLLIVVFGSWYPFALFGCALWGLGTALGFPTGISAAADDSRRAAARVSVAASIGYVAFLAGPPLIGFVGNHVGVLHGLTVTAGVIVLALIVSGAIAPLASEDDASASTTHDRVE
jgi:predicted MFS family arabinose efflux permease